MRNSVITTRQKDQKSSHQSTEAIKLELPLEFTFLRLANNKVTERSSGALQALTTGGNTGK